jgi:hypothetical protein
MDWQPVAIYPHDDFGNNGRASYTRQGRQGMQPFPSHVLLRNGRKTISLKTSARDGAPEDVDLALSKSDFSRIGGTGIASAKVQLARAHLWHRYWYQPSFKLAAFIAVVTWLATVAAALLSYARFRTDTASSGARFDGGIATLATIVLFLAAVAATAKLVADLQRPDD